MPLPKRNRGLTRSRVPQIIATKAQDNFNGYRRYCLPRDHQGGSRRNEWRGGQTKVRNKSQPVGNSNESLDSTCLESGSEFRIECEVGTPAKNVKKTKSGGVKTEREYGESTRRCKMPIPSGVALFPLLV